MTPEEIAAQFGASPSRTQPVGTPHGNPNSPEAIAAQFTKNPVPDGTPPEKDIGEDTSNWVDRINAAGQGMSFGFADEAGSALAATAAKLGGSEDDWSDIYGSMMDSEAGKRKTFADHNPLENLALQVAGGLTSGGAGLVKAVPKIAAKMGGGKLATTGATSLVGAGEGAVAGFGSTDGDLGDRAEGAGLGLATGAVLPLAMSGGGKAVRGIANRRTAQDLGKGKDFIPLNQADEGALGDFYRNVVGKTFGGRQKMIDQSARKVGSATRADDIAGGRLTAATKAKSDAVRRAKNEIDTRYAGKTSAVERQVDEALTGVEKSGNAAVTQARTDMQQELIDGAIPRSVPQKTADKIRAAAPDEANLLASKAWADHGFKSLNQKRYTANAEQIKNSFKKVLGRDPAMNQAGEGFESMVDEVFTKYGAKNGTITGKALMELRNSMKGVKGGDGRSALAPAAYGKMATEIETLLKSGMNKAEIGAFDDDLAKWGGKRSLSNAVKSARTKRQGNPDESDVLTAARKSGGKAYEMGRAPAQKAAENVQLTAAKAAERLKAAKEVGASGLKQSKEMITKGKNALKVGAERKGDLALGMAESTAGKTKRNLKAIKEASPADNVSMFEKLFATGLTGGGYGLTNIASGTTLSRALASPKVQRVLAGQTKGQEKLANALRNVDESQLTDLLRLAPSAAVSGREDEFENAIFGR